MVMMMIMLISKAKKDGDDGGGGIKLLSFINIKSTKFKAKIFSAHTILLFCSDKRPL